MAVQTDQQLTLDESQEKGFVTFFKSLSKKAAMTMRLFDRGEFYTAHGDDATLAANLVFNSTAAVKQIGSAKNRIDSLLLNKANFERLIRDLLLVRQYRVEVFCNQSASAARDDWVVKYKGSPGNLSQFEEILWNGVGVEDAGGVMMAVCVADGKVAVALVDTIERSFKVAQVADDEYLSALEGLLVQNAPQECLVPATGHDHVQKVLERVGVLVTLRKRADWSAEGAEQDLNRLIAFADGQQHNSLALPQMKLGGAISGLAALIKYLELLGDAGNEGQFTLSDLKLGGFVRLDAAAVRALNVLPTTRASGRQHCLLGLLDRCRTPQGRRLLARWLVQPLTDLNALCERHDVVGALLDDGELRQELSEDHLRRMPDLGRLANKMGGSKVTLQECYKVYQAVGRLPMLVKSLSSVKDCAAVSAMLIAPLEELAADLAPFRQMVETTMDLDLVEQGEFVVKANFDVNLTDSREQMQAIESGLQKQLNRAAADLNLEPGKTLKLENNPQYGYFYRVTLKDEKSIRNNKKYEILDSNKAGIRFRDNKISELNESYVSLSKSYSGQQGEVVTEIVEIAAGYSEVVRRLGAVVATLDVLTSFAVVAAEAPKQLVRPQLRAAAPGAGVLSLRQVRHPCVELQDGISYIPNDVELRQGATTLSVVTGPNMGGKSTFIRSVAVAALLAHVGSFVPCDAAEMSLVDAICSRVGADDSQLKGMSTFMMEMVEAAALVRTATEYSLAILDELGRGTSTYDGCGMAWAIAEHLATQVKPLTLFATHFHELSTLADRLPAVSNLHVTAAAEGDTLTLLYTLKPGFCDQSFGLHVARMADFPESVLREAAAKQAELEAAQAHCNDPRVLEEGEKMVKEFLEKCKQLLSAGLDESELMKQVEKLKLDIRASKNSYVDSLVA